MGASVTNPDMIVEVESFTFLAPSSPPSQQTRVTVRRTRALNAYAEYSISFHGKSEPLRVRFYHTYSPRPRGQPSTGAQCFSMTLPAAEPGSPCSKRWPPVSYTGPIPPCAAGLETGMRFASHSTPRC